MELFQAAELQTNEVQNGWSSVVWLGATLAVVWLVSVSGIQIAGPLATSLAELTALLQTVF